MSWIDASEKFPGSIAKQLLERLDSIESRLARLEATDPETESSTASVASTLPPPASEQAFRSPEEQRAKDTEIESPPGEEAEPEQAEEDGEPGGSDHPLPSPPARDDEPSAGQSPTTGMPGGRAMEELVGGRLFTWIGGGVLVLSTLFLIPYLWKHFDMPAWGKVLGLHALGLGVLVVGVVLPRRVYEVTSHALTGLGLFILYASAYSALHVFGVYTEWFGNADHLATMLECSAITVLSIVLALRRNHVGVIVLGALCGYLTPILTSTGSHNGIGLFGYLALLNVALVVADVARSWRFLTPAAWLATLAMFAGWFASGDHRHLGPDVNVALMALHGLIFLGATVIPPCTGKARSSRIHLALLPGTAFLFLGGVVAAYPAREPEFFTGFAVVLSLLYLGSSRSRVVISPARTGCPGSRSRSP